jgi:hypothetical protein
LYHGYEDFLISGFIRNIAARSGGIQGGNKTAEASPTTNRWDMLALNGSDTPAVTDHMNRAAQKTMSSKLYVSGLPSWNAKRTNPTKTIVRAEVYQSMGAVGIGILFVILSSVQAKH